MTTYLWIHLQNTFMSTNLPWQRNSRIQTAANYTQLSDNEAHKRCKAGNVKRHSSFTSLFAYRFQGIFNVLQNLPEV